MSSYTVTMDQLSIVSIEALFDKQVNELDYWVAESLYRFADALVWAEHIGTILPYSERIGKKEGLPRPITILECLDRHDPTIARRIPFITDSASEVSPDKFPLDFRTFAEWALLNVNNLRLWAKYQSTKLRQEIHKRYYPQTYAYPVRYLIDDSDFILLRQRLQLSDRSLLYIYDAAMRYRLYAPAILDGSYYLSHPMREDQTFKTAFREIGSLPLVPFTLKYALAKERERLKSLDALLDFILKARRLVREHRLLDLSPGSAIPFDELQKIGYELGLMPITSPEAHRVLNLLGKVKDSLWYSTGVMGGLLLIPGINEYLTTATGITALTATAVGAGIKFVEVFHSSIAAKTVGKWLRWPYHYELESGCWHYLGGSAMDAAPSEE
jgi:hypothetical protein